jgi:hypothetical protein
MTISGTAYDEASVVLDITAQREDGTEVTSQRTITYTRLSGPVSGGIEASALVFRKNDKGNYDAPLNENGDPEITLEGKAPNVTGATFDWDVENDGNDIQTTNPLSVTPSDIPEAANTVQIKMTEQLTGQTDTVTIAEVRQGKSGITPVLTNENHTYPSGHEGNISVALAGGNCGVRVYEGITQLDYDGSDSPADGKFSVSVASRTNIGTGDTIANTTSEATYKPGGSDGTNDLTADDASVTLDITVNPEDPDKSEQTIQKTITYSKARQGNPSEFYYIRATNGRVIRNSDSGTTLDLESVLVEGPSESTLDSGDPALYTKDGNTYNKLGTSSSVLDNADPHHPSIGASQISDGRRTLYLRDANANTLDTISLADLTDAVSTGFVETNKGVVITYYTDVSPNTEDDDIAPDTLPIDGVYVPISAGEKRTNINIETRKAGGQSIEAKWVKQSTDQLDAVNVTRINDNGSTDDVPHDTWMSSGRSWEFAFNMSDPTTGDPVPTFSEQVQFQKDTARYLIKSPDDNTFTSDPNSGSVVPSKLKFKARKVNTNTDTLVNLDDSPFRLELWDDTDATGPSVVYSTDYSGGSAPKNGAMATDGNGNDVAEVFPSEVYKSAELRLIKDSGGEDTTLKTIQVIDQREGTDGGSTRLLTPRVTKGTDEWKWSRDNESWTPGLNADTTSDGTDNIDSRHTTVKATFTRGPDTLAKATVTVELDEGTGTLTQFNTNVETTGPGTSSWDTLGITSGDGTDNAQITFKYTDDSEGKPWRSDIQYEEGALVYYEGDAGTNGNYRATSTTTAGTAPPNGSWDGPVTPTFEKKKSIKATRDGRNSASPVQISGDSGTFVLGSGGSYGTDGDWVNPSISVGVDIGDIPTPIASPSWDINYVGGGSTQKSGDPISVSHPSDSSVSEVEVSVTVTDANNNSYSSYEDSETFLVLEEGTDGFTLEVENDETTYKVNADGEVVGTVGDGQAKFRMYEGATQLTITDITIDNVDPTGALSANTSPGSNEEVDVASYTPTGVSSSFSGATVTASITATQKNGNSVTRTKDVRYFAEEAVVVVESERGVAARALGDDAKGAYVSNAAIGHLVQLGDNEDDTLSNQASRWRSYLSKTGDFYLNDAADNSALEYLADFQGSKGIFSVGNTSSAKDFFDPNKSASSGNFFAYHDGEIALNGKVSGQIGGVGDTLGRALRFASSELPGSGDNVVIGPDQSVPVSPAATIQTKSPSNVTLSSVNPWTLDQQLGETTSSPGDYKLTSSLKQYLPVEYSFTLRVSIDSNSTAGSTISSIYIDLKANSTDGEFGEQIDSINTEDFYFGGTDEFHEVDVTLVGNVGTLTNSVWTEFTTRGVDDGIDGIDLEFKNIQFGQYAPRVVINERGIFKRQTPSRITSLDKSGSSTTVQGSSGINFQVGRQISFDTSTSPRTLNLDDTVSADSVSDAHHKKYTDSDAVSAIESQDTLNLKNLDLDGTFHIDGSKADWGDLGIAQSDVDAGDVGKLWTIKEGDGQTANVYGNETLKVYGGNDITTEITADGEQIDLRVAHANTSNQGNVSTSGATVIEDIDFGLNGNGHVSNINTDDRRVSDWLGADSDINMNSNKLVFQPASSGGSVTGLHFKSNTNAGSDLAKIIFDDDYGGDGTGERAALRLRVENDSGGSAGPDSIVLDAVGGVDMARGNLRMGGNAIDVGGGDVYGVNQVDGNDGNHRIRFDSSNSWIEFTDQSNNRNKIVTQDTFVDGLNAWLTDDDLVDINAGSGLNGGGSTGLTDQMTISHADTSSQGNVNTGGATVIDDVHTDGYGHVTNMNTENRTLDQWDAPEADVGFGGYRIHNIERIGLNNQSTINAGQVARDDQVGIIARWGGNTTAVLWDVHNVNGGTDIDITGGTGDTGATIAHSDTGADLNTQPASDSVISRVDTDGRGHVDVVSTESRAISDWTKAESNINLDGNGLDNVGVVDFNDPGQPTSADDGEVYYESDATTLSGFSGDGVDQGQTSSLALYDDAQGAWEGVITSGSSPYWDAEVRSAQTSGYVDKQTEWSISHDGRADFREIYTDELVAKTFTVDLTQALAGSDFLVKSVANLDAAFVVPAAASADGTADGGTATLTVQDNPGAKGLPPFAQGDWLRLRIVDNSSGGLVIVDAWLKVVDHDGDGSVYVNNGDGTHTFDVQRGDAQGAATGKTVPREAPVLDYGQSGQGTIRRTVEGENAPYSAIETWTDNPVQGANYDTKVMVGKLSGAPTLPTGTQPEGYGLFADNAYLEGEVVASEGEIAGWELTESRLEKQTAFGTLVEGGLLSWEGLTSVERQGNQTLLDWPKPVTGFGASGDNVSAHVGVRGENGELLVHQDDDNYTSVGDGYNRDEMGLTVRSSGNTIIDTDTTSATIAGWTATENRLAAEVSGPSGVSGIELSAKGNSSNAYEQHICVHGPQRNSFVSMYAQQDQAGAFQDWGIVGVDGSLQNGSDGKNKVFHLGDHNEIAGWTFTSSLLKSTNVEIGSSGLNTSEGVKLGKFASGDIMNRGLYIEDGNNNQLQVGTRDSGTNFTMYGGSGDFVSIGPGGHNRSSMGVTIQAGGNNIFETSKTKDFGGDNYYAKMQNLYVDGKINTQSGQIANFNIKNNHIELPNAGTSSSDVRLGETFYSDHWGISVYESVGNYARLIQHENNGYELDITNDNSHFYAGNGYQFNGSFGVELKYSGTTVLRAVEGESNSPYIDNITVGGNATVEGTLNATDGNIANWTINSNKLYKDTNGRRYGVGFNVQKPWDNDATVMGSVSNSQDAIGIGRGSRDVMMYDNGADYHYIRANDDNGGQFLAGLHDGSWKVYLETTSNERVLEVDGSGATIAGFDFTNGKLTNDYSDGKIVAGPLGWAGTTGFGFKGGFGQIQIGERRGNPNFLAYASNSNYVEIGAGYNRDEMGITVESNGRTVFETRTSDNSNWDYNSARISNLYIEGDTAIEGSAVIDDTLTADKIDVNDLLAESITVSGSLRSSNDDTRFNAAGVQINAGGGAENSVQFFDDLTANDPTSYGRLFSSTNSNLTLKNNNGGVVLSAPSDDIRMEEGGHIVLPNHEHGESEPSKNYALYVDSNGYVKMSPGPTTNDPPTADLSGSGIGSTITWDATGSFDPNGQTLEYKFNFDTNTSGYDTGWKTSGVVSNDYGSFNEEYTAKVKVRDSSGTEGKTDTATATATTQEEGDSPGGGGGGGGGRLPAL